MQIAEVLKHLEEIAPPAYQESYDNSGLIVGEQNTEVKGVLVSLDCIEETVDEAIQNNCNLIVAHHPIVFSGLKRFNNANYVQRTVQKAIKNDIALYAIHTNLDNVFENGVNTKLAEKIGLKNSRILAPKESQLTKLVTYCPKENYESILNALFEAGAGSIGNYSECSFIAEGTGSFKGDENSNPVVGKAGELQQAQEIKLEVILPSYLKSSVINALFKAHPYEEVAYNLFSLVNTNQHVGSGMIGELDKEYAVSDFLGLLKDKLSLSVIKYTSCSKSIKTVAICGGSGQFLLSSAIRSGADAYVTSDFKYHQFFDAENHLTLCDIGHYESEKHTIDLLYDIMTEKFSTFAVLKTGVESNPIKYFI